jgi:acyl-CoA thioesterase
MSPVRFRTDTAVSPVGDGRYAANIVDGWDINGNANGGYLLAIAARAIAAESGRPDPYTITAHYLAPGKPGPITVDVDIVRSGRLMVTSTARMRDSEGKVLMQLLAGCGDLATSAGPEQITIAPPDVPPPDECASTTNDLVPMPFRARIEVRLHPDDAGFVRGEPSGQAVIRGWFRLRDSESLDTIAVLQAVDAFPPAVFNTSLPVSWVPTLELTTHVRARAEGEWLRCRLSTNVVAGGFLEEESEVWDEQGRFIAQSRQLALVPRPK